MSTIANIEPSSFVAGDTVQWKKSFQDYPASDDWELSYAVRGPDSVDLAYDTEVVADGNDFLITWDTSGISPGNYWWQGTITNGTLTRTVASGQFEVKAGLAAAAANYDGRSHVKKTLDALEALLEGKATSDQKSYKIGDREIEKLSPGEVLAFYKQYKKWYAQEVRRDRLAKGLPASNKIQVRF